MISRHFWILTKQNNPRQTPHRFCQETAHQKKRMKTNRKNILRSQPNPVCLKPTLLFSLVSLIFFRVQPFKEQFKFCHYQPQVITTLCDLLGPWNTKCELFNFFNKLSHTIAMSKVLTEIQTKAIDFFLTQQLEPLFTFIGKIKT